MSSARRTMHPQNPTPILEVQDVGKSYGRRRALDRVSFVVRPGEVVGLLGPNGAGKTTTLSILSSVLAPDRGRVTIGGRSLREHRDLRRRIGLVPQSIAIYPTLGASQNVAYFARMHGLSRAAAAAAAAEALDAVGLADRAHDAARTLSGGLQRRLNLACGIVHRPAILLLDEPTVGVDLESREQILVLVRRLRDDGIAVVYSTHYMEEVERVCDRVLLIDRGTLVADDTAEALIARAGSRPRMEITCRGRPPDGATAAIRGVRELARAGSEGRLVLEMESLALVTAVLESLTAAGVTVLDFSLHSPNLADAFLLLTGRSLHERAAA
jgi:linearmycin/streptolysin S transport system ATP-binding protein